MTTLEKIRAEFIARYPKNYANEPELGGRSCVFSLNEVLQIVDKYANQESCEDAISRQYLLNNCIVDKVTMPYVPISKIQEAPPVAPQPKIGHWIFDDKCKEHGHCSHCGYGRVDLVNGEPHDYCQNCGAKMEKVEE